MQIEAKRMERFESSMLGRGAHDSLEVGGCVVEWAAYLAGAPHSDYPTCVSPVIGAFLRRWNDDLNDADRQMLKPYALKAINTAASPEIEAARAWLATDWLVRVHTPAWLELAGLKEQADALRALPEVTKASVAGAQPTIAEARSKAAAAGAAARTAAWDAAWDAAWAAARTAAWAAAGAAAGAAAKEKLQPVMASLQQSALQLLDRMIAMKGGEAA